jgi:serine phosphatase RsbU (regulator of sigma subunit)
LTVAEVAAKGLGAALFLAAARGAIQAQERSAAPPSDLLVRVNEILFSDFDAPELSATACHLRLAAGAGGRAVYANAGHVPPVVLRPGGEASFLERGGPALGILPDAVYPEGSFEMEAGSAVLLFTEGLLRARGVGGTPYGIERLVDRARRDLRLPAAEMRERLLRDVEAHTGRGGTIDECVLVVAKIEESAP